MANNSESWIKRANALIAQGPKGRCASSEMNQFAISMIATFYGPQSPQIREFQAGRELAAKMGAIGTGIGDPEWDHAAGTIRNLIAELEAGLIANLRTAVAGEILAELVRVGKEILQDKTDEAKNVGSVLIAAAYEGTLRKMGEEFASITDRVDLPKIITALKERGVLKGGSVSIAQSYLKFRNDSLHADWANVERSQVESCLTFVESQLAKHFS